MSILQKPMKIFISKTMHMSLLQKRVSLDPSQRLGPFWSFQFRCYARSSNYKNRRLTAQPEPLHSHSWSNFILPTTLMVIAGAGLLIRYYNDERRAIPEGASQVTELKRRTINKPAFGGPFRLIDTEYRLVTECDLRGCWTLLYFGYTSSPDVGPEELKKMAKAIDILEFDTRIVGLTGSIDAIRQTAQEYRVYFKKVEEIGQDYLVASSHNMYLMDPNMEIVRCFTQAYNAEELTEDILKEVKKCSKSDKQA
ncbi:protein SCO1 homolog 2, mitochondrial-like isoform X6 [Tasmannia lanceolata]|uniref:protein SCO1 homolog 2, mitochondrial-like isoform X6 n=1 Tax=Tasmannia lanceolata TaxID=3420 RepID=UPI00406296CD